jgi:serine/threonine protein kinase
MYLGVGELIADKYRIIRLLGKGGMEAVYEGENVRIRHRVAIKVRHAAVANNREVVDRFEREAQVAGQAGSEHIVEVLDLGELSNGPALHRDGVLFGLRSPHPLFLEFAAVGQIARHLGKPRELVRWIA